MSRSSAWSWARPKSPPPQASSQDLSSPHTHTTPLSPKPRRPSITALLSNSFTSISSNHSSSPSPPTYSPPTCDTSSVVSTISAATLNATAPSATAGAAITASSTSSLRRKMQRSYSQSHARTGSYVMSSHTAAPTLGQGATVVRTPSDATMFMAQPGANGSWPMTRQSSLRSPPRRPSEGAPLPEYLAPRVDGEAAPLLPPFQQTASLTTDFASFTFPDPSSATQHSRQPSRALSRSPSAPNQSRAAVDTSGGYQPGRRLTGRTSGSTLQASASLSRVTRNGPSPSPSQTSMAPPPTPSLTRSDSQMSSAPSRSSPTSPPRRSPTHCREPSCTRLNTPTHVHSTRPSNGSEDALTPRVRPVMPPPPTPPPSAPRISVVDTTPPPILISHSVRTTKEATSMVLVTLRFGFSLDAEPNTHSVTVTLDTLRPAGGRLIEFLDKVLHPRSPAPSPSPTHTGGRDSGIGTSGAGTPLTTESSMPESSLEMTDGSSAEDSDFEYDNAQLHPNLMDEYVVAQTLSASSTPAKAPASTDAAPPRPARRQYPPTAYPYAGLPPLADLPAALAQAKAAAEAKTHQKRPQDPSSQQSRVGRPRASTCPGPAVGVVTEVTILLQREAGAWHAIASRLCSGSWPCLDGRRRRVEDECKWAGMGGLVAELRAPATVVRSSAGGARCYI